MAFRDFGGDLTKASVLTCKTSYCDGKTSYQLEPLTGGTTRVCPTHPRGIDDNDYAYVEEMAKMAGATRLPCGGTAGNALFMPTCTIRCTRTCPDASTQLYTTAVPGSANIPPTMCPSSVVTDPYSSPIRCDANVCQHCTECAQSGVRYVDLGAPPTSPGGLSEKIPFDQSMMEPFTQVSPKAVRKSKSEEDVYAQARHNLPTGGRQQPTSIVKPYREKTCSPVLCRKN